MPCPGCLEDDVGCCRCTGEGERRIRILALLTRFPRSHYTRDAKGVLERIMEKFGSWLERRDTMFCVETSFMIAPRHATYEAQDLATFIMNLATRYNGQVPRPHMRVYERITQEYRPPGWAREVRNPQLRLWLVSLPMRGGALPRAPRVGHAGNHFSDLESLSSSQSSTEKMTLMSPAFYGSSPWRDHVEGLWSYLNEHYVIQEDHRSNTEVQIILDPLFTIMDTKRIAQAVIHFEPIFDLFMPDLHESTNFTRKIWRDHPQLGGANLNQAESIARVEEIQANMPPGNDRSAMTSVCSRLWPVIEYGWSWNLDACVAKPVEFGRLPASATPGDVIFRADLVLSFVLAAIACPSPAQLQRVASNRLGLQYFLTGKLNPTSRKRIRGVWWHVDLQTNQPIVHSETRVGTPQVNPTRIPGRSSER
jgi:hypothetical protein